jgi:hypothetical protein
MVSLNSLNFYLDHIRRSASDGSVPPVSTSVPRTSRPKSPPALPSPTNDNYQPLQVSPTPETTSEPTTNTLSSSDLPTQLKLPSGTNLVTSLNNEASVGDSNTLILGPASSGSGSGFGASQTVSLPSQVIWTTSVPSEIIQIGSIASEIIQMVSSASQISWSTTSTYSQFPRTRSAADPISTFPPSPETSQNRHRSPGPILGGIFGGLAAVIVILFMVWIIRKRRRKSIRASLRSYKEEDSVT